MSAFTKIFVAFLFPVTFFSQNLVLNGDFEEYTTIPKQCDQVFFTSNWARLRGSPDFYHQDGYMGGWFHPRQAFSGKGQIGICTWVDGYGQFRECVETRLVKPLDKGKKYRLSFYVSNGSGNEWTYTSNNLGAYFSKDSIKTDFSGPTEYAAQCEIKEQVEVKDGWKKYSFIYTAEDAMHYLSFGNFRSDNETATSKDGANGAYYFIDKVELVPVERDEQGKISEGSASGKIQSQEKK